MPKIDVNSLVFDYSLYPRTEIDSVTITDLTAAAESGAEFPPIIVEKGTNRIVDGFHRTTALKQMGIQKISATYKTYSSDAELYLDAVMYNSGHGRKLSRYDQIRIIIQAEKFNIEPEVIASALNITIERAELLKIKKTASGNTKITPIIPIKRTLQHLAGKKLTSKQIKGNDNASGMSPLFYINQVINMIENDLIDWSNDNLVGKLVKLGEMIVQRKAVGQ